MTGALASVRLATGRWELVTTLSTAELSVRHLGTKQVRGTVPIADAAVRVDADGRPVGVTAVLALDGIDTGHARRDADLRKPRLLDTARYPQLRFVASDVHPTADGWTVTGTLSGRGHDVEVTLDAQVSAAADACVSVVATTIVDRTDLGVRAPRFLIGRSVAITIRAVFGPPA